MKKKKIGIISIVLLLALIGVTIGLCLCATLAYKDTYAEKDERGTKDDSFVGDTFKAALFGKNFELSEAQINTFFNERYCSENPESGNGLEKIHIYFHPDDQTEIYAKLKCKGYDFAFYSKAAISMDGEGMLRVNLYDTKLGELTLPDWLLSWALSQIFSDNENINADATAISVKAGNDYTLGNISINLSLKHFLPKEGGVNCQTNNLTREAIRVVRQYCLSAEGRKMLKELFNFEPDDIKDAILSLFS